EALAPIADTVAIAAVNAAEAADSLRRRLDGLDVNPERLQWVENRIGSIRDIARKHQVEPAELPAVLDRLQGELEDLDQSEERLDALTRQVEKWDADYRDSAQKLHEARAKAA